MSAEALQFLILLAGFIGLITTGWAAMAVFTGIRAVAKGRCPWQAINEL